MVVLSWYSGNVSVSNSSCYDFQKPLITLLINLKNAFGIGMTWRPFQIQQYPVKREFISQLPLMLSREIIIKEYIIVIYLFLLFYLIFPLVRNVICFIIYEKKSHA